MNQENAIWNMSGWLFALLLVTIGILNLIQVHPVPGIIYLLLALIFVPPLTQGLKNRTGFTIPVAVKIILGFIIIWFTLGVSDLAQIYGL